MIFTSEQVSMGHPDKICDQISDAIVTECLRYDKNSRVAAECLIKDYDITIAGEITSEHKPDYKVLVSKVLSNIGLCEIDKYKVRVQISEQSVDIALGVDNHMGAGDQGMMFGYATNETPELMPIPYAVATQALKLLRDSNSPLLLPDAKSQVTFDYSTNRILTFLISTQHREEASAEEISSLVKAVMKTAAINYGLNTDFNELVNPTGRFVIGSSFADSGLTGRKIIADTYGGICRHGGGSFSGKDPTKVDRSGAYMARKIARDIVSNQYADRCEVQIAYAISVAEPISVSLECFGTNHVPLECLKDFIYSNYNLTPAGIIKTLNLLDVDYNQVSSYGHFGKSYLPWEQ
ncbi:methionine adenosyltransferase [Clostridium polynesiense]|uniref:methionine adenosyltransferase n=1 Tax=Clostridium polynesiense TaxID=1325933 RepID=UPI000590FD93|nr:methionine adenosyltransferase [Clostridium polynesiense]